MVKTKFSTKKRIRGAVQDIENADAKLTAIRDHFQMEWGEGQNTDLDVALSSAMMALGKVADELNEVLRVKKLTLNFRRRRNKTR